MEEFSFDDFEDAGYNAVLKDGAKIRIENWPPLIGIKNLTMASKILGDANVLAISKLDTHAAIVAVMNADDADLSAKMVTHFCTCCVMDGKRIEKESFDNMFEKKMHVVMEIFTHVIHSQYHDFFEFGLVKEPSQEQSAESQTV